MTKREFLNAVIALNDEVTTEFAKAEIEKMDARNASRKDKPSKKSVENEPIKARIAEVLTDTPQTASEIASKVKVPKKGTQKAYSL